MVTLCHLYRSSQKQPKATANQEPTQEFKSTAVLHHIKVYQRFFAAAYNNEVYTLSSNLTQLLGPT